MNSKSINTEIFKLIEIYSNLHFEKFLNKLKLRFPKSIYLENFNLKNILIKKYNMNKFNMNKFNWTLVKKNPYEFANNITQSELELYIIEADKNYYNNESIIDDNQYDILYNFVENNYPNSKLLKNIGSQVVSKYKITLPVILPSMDKIKADTNALEKWKKDFKGPYICSDKLDGMSLLLIAKNRQYNAYTRGNGIIGQDISWITKYLKCGDLVNGMIRGELVVSKEKWLILKKIYPKYSNARNFVSGYTAKKNIDAKMMKYIDFVAYEYITQIPLKFNEQFKIISDLKLNTVYNIIYDNVTNNSVSTLLENRRTNSKYEIDGIIVASNLKPYKRNSILKNPKYAKAFKMVLDDQTAEVHVTGITWNPSMHGVLKPIVNISKIHLDGVNIQNVTGNNAKFLLNNTIGGKIGPGSILKLTRSGGVIPKILKVITSYDGDIKNILPENFEFKWNSTKVDILLINPNENKFVKLKRIEHFMNALKIPYLKTGLIKKLYENGHTTINNIVNIKEDDLLKIDGIKNKSANKILISISNGLQKATLTDYMTGTHLFGSGFGKKKIDPILKNIPNLVNIDLENPEQKKELFQKIILINGYQERTANKFINGLVDFQKFIQPFSYTNLQVLESNKPIENRIYSGYIFTYTGFRPDLKLKKYIIENGGLWETSVKKCVTHLIYKNTNKNTNNNTNNNTNKSNKIIKAEAMGIKIIDMNDIISKIN